MEIENNLTVNVKETNQKINNSKSSINSWIPLKKRKAFPLCFWFKGYEIDIKYLEQIIRERCELLFVKDKFEIYVFRGSHEEDKIRVFSPDINLDCGTMKDLRNFILEGLGIFLKSSIIPSLIYDLNVHPNIYQTKYYDIGYKKKFNKKFKCLNKDIKSEDILKMLNKALEYDEEIEKTELTETYLEYINQKGDEEDDIIFKISGNESEITKNARKEIGKDFDLCVNWFLSLHNDSQLRKAWSMNNEKELYILDFKKSKKKCRICKIHHNGNRQYLVYSKLLRTAYYKCHDVNAENKKYIRNFSLRD